MGRQLTPIQIKKRLDFILNGMSEGQTLKEIGILLGTQEKGKPLSAAIITNFLNTYWNIDYKFNKILERKELQYYGQGRNQEANNIPGTL